MTNQSKNHSSTAPMVAGLLGGAVSTTLLLPLDVIKLRLQVSESETAGSVGSTSTTILPRNMNKRRLGSMGVIRGIVKHEGVGGLYQGWLPAVIGSSVAWGGYFFFYEGMKRQLLDYRSKNHHSHLAQPWIAKNRTDLSVDPTVRASVPKPTSTTSLDNFVLACAAGSIMVFVTNPIWLIKTRMQLQMRKASQQHGIQPYNGTLDAIRTIVRQEGAMALYKGTGPALLLTSHGGVQFVVYEFLRKQFHDSRLVTSANRPVRNRDENEPRRNVWQRLQLSAGYLTMGAVSKIVASTVTYPLQVIKSRLQQRAEALELSPDGQVQAVQRQYHGLVSTTRAIWQREGTVGFFKGCIPNAVRVAPGAAVTFVVYEMVMDYYQQ